MKTRSGFVSNSSSSSFMVITKGGELTQDRVLAALAVDKDSPLYSFALEVASSLSYVPHLDKFDTIQKLREKWEWFDDEEFAQRCEDEIRWISNGWTIYSGSTSDESASPAQMWLCYTEFETETDDLIIESEGGY